MIWLLLVTVPLVLLVVLPRVARRRRLIFSLGGQPVSTLSMSRKHDKRKRAALDAASSVLR
jgi:hypothetical protein